MPGYSVLKCQGDVAELLFPYRTVALGLIVSKPYGDNAKYDFLLGRRPIDKGEGVVKDRDIPPGACDTARESEKVRTRTLNSRAESLPGGAIVPPTIDTAPRRRPARSRRRAVHCD